VPGRREVDDREPAMAEADSRLSIDPQTDIVRTPMSDRDRHRLEDALVDPAPADDPGDSAHATCHSGCEAEMEGLGWAHRSRHSCSRRGLCLSACCDGLVQDGWQKLRNRVPITAGAGSVIKQFASAMVARASFRPDTCA
jgi:hypothetical protein